MKKMSEVFELPVAGELNQGEPFLSDENYYFASFDDELSYEDGGGLERAHHAAHAINHVDALAGALQALFDDYKALADSGDAGKWKLEETSVGIEAMAALAAYRGEK